MLFVLFTSNQLRVVLNALDSYYYCIVDDDKHPAKSDLRMVRVILNRLKRTADPEADREKE